MPLTSLSFEQARKNLNRDRVSLWPSSPREQARLRGVASVAFTPSFTLESGEAIFTVGSCFARNIELRLKQLGFDLPTSDVRLDGDERGGVGAANNILNKYTPYSILNEFRWALDPQTPFPDAAFVHVEGELWADPHSAPQIKPATLARQRERRAMIADLYAQLPRCRVVVMTLGLVESWFDTTTGLYLNGNPPPATSRREPDRFQLHVLSVEEISEALEEIHGLLSRYGHPQFRLLLTVSPVPLAATFRGIDVITANTYSKSALRAAAEALVARHDNVDYLPSYEIVSHSERALTFGDDCRHVSTPVVTAIVDRMVAHYVPGAVAEPAPAQSGPEVDGTRRRVADALRIKDYARAIQALSALEGGDWAAAGYSEFGFRVDYARVLMSDDKFMEAEPQLARALELEPESSVVLLGLARARRRLGRRREAEACYARAAELNPEDAQMHYLLASEMAWTRRHSEAVPRLIRCLALQPDHAQARALLDDCNRRLASDWTEAAPDAPEQAPDEKAGARGLGALTRGFFRRRPSPAADDAR